MPLRFKIGTEVPAQPDAARFTPARDLGGLPTDRFTIALNALALAQPSSAAIVLMGSFRAAIDSARASSSRWRHWPKVVPSSDRIGRATVRVLAAA